MVSSGQGDKARLETLLEDGVFQTGMARLGVSLRFACRDGKFWLSGAETDTLSVGVKDGGFVVGRTYLDRDLRPIFVPDARGLVFLKAQAVLGEIARDLAFRFAPELGEGFTHNDRGGDRWFNGGAKCNKRPGNP